MNSEQIHWWVKIVLTIVSMLLTSRGQITMAKTLLDKYDPLMLS